LNVSAVLAHKLIETLVGHDPLTLGIDVGAMTVGWRGAIDGHAEAHGLAIRAGAEHEVQVARVETIDDAAVLLVEHNMLGADGPIAGKLPLVELRRITGGQTSFTAPPGEMKFSARAYPT
jgi:hypothetical protein